MSSGSIILRKTIAEVFLQRVQENPSAIGFQFKPTHSELGAVGQWKQVSFKEFYSECRLISFGLMGLNIQAGDRIVILSNSRFEWSLVDMAILGASAVGVPIYASSTVDDIIYIIRHCDARIIIVEDGKLLQKILDRRAESPDCLPCLEKVILIEPKAMALARKYPEAFKNILTLQALRELGRREEAKNPSRFDQNLSQARPDDVITICYTSGTTGIPKGVILTHDNLMSVIEDCASILGSYIRPDQEIILSFLPFSHIFGRLESLCTYAFGWRQVFAESLEKLSANISEIRPTLLFAVPRTFEKAYNRIFTAVNSGKLRRKRLFYRALGIGQKYFGAIWGKGKPSFVLSLEYQLANQFVFGKVANQFGGRLRFAVCGGAPLPREIGEFFQIAGVKILEGYGLTETFAPVSVNTPNDIRFGAVGRPLPEVTFKIAEDGEILIQSRKVFKGYYKMQEETDQVLKGGWFHTGDIGHIDSDGFLHITDRKKDLIVTSSGKNIAPQKIENLAKLQKFIHEFVVHGDQRHYLTALVTLDRDLVIQYANENQILFSEYAQLIKNPKILSLTQKIINEVNQKLAGYETIKKFVILPEDFSIETGEMTPSLKIRRSFINQRYKAELDTMYADSVRVSVN